MYITTIEYVNLTDGDIAEATDARIKRASQLLDARIGNHTRIDDSTNDYDGWKLDLDTLATYKVDAVKDWVAWMVFALVENDDAISVNETLKLGRFSVTPKNTDNGMMPDQLIYSDQILMDSGLIKRGVRYTNSPTTSTVINE